MIRGIKRATCKGLGAFAAQTAALLALFFVGAVQMLGQAQSPPLGVQQHSIADAPADEPPQRITDTMRAKRNEERQKRIISDSQRLLVLANQLKSEIASSSAEAMTPEMLKQIDEIEHLAKSVKDKMRY